MRLFDRFKKPEMSQEAKTQNEQLNKILNHLASKHIGQWTKEADIEKHFQDTIPGFHVTVNLQKLHKEGMADYSRNMCEFKISTEGRAFLTTGGYK